jgi:hypothetical protein
MFGNDLNRCKAGKKSLEMTHLAICWRWQSEQTRYDLHAPDLPPFVNCRPYKKRLVLLGLVGLSAKKWGTIEEDKHFDSICSSSIRRSGGVWKRHCKALLRKHVLPLLYKPLAVLQFNGQVVSITPVWRGAALPLEVVAVDAFGGDRGGEALRGRCFFC